MNTARATHAEIYGETIDPITFTINGSGLGLCLIIGLIILTALMISREARA